MLGADPVSYAVAFTAGFVSFASPCVLPVVPGYIGFISGAGLEERRAGRSAVAIPTAAFVFGFAVAFTILGASVGMFGNVLLQERRTLEIAGGVFVIVMGVLLLGRGVPMFLQRDRRVHLTRRPVTLAGAAVAGVAFGIGWTPCTGPTLGAALTLAASSGSVVLGGSLLLTYALGLGIPFLLAGLFLHQATHAMGFMKRHIRIINVAGAALLIVSGVLLATGELTRIGAQFQGGTTLL